MKWSSSTPALEAGLEITEICLPLSRIKKYAATPTTTPANKAVFGGLTFAEVKYYLAATE